MPKQPHDQKNTLALQKVIDRAWAYIPPSWPLQNFIATNPGMGFEDLEFEIALEKLSSYFQTNDIPAPMHHVNLICIKWLSTFFDEGQCFVEMPSRNQGLLKSILDLIPFDKQIKKPVQEKKSFIKKLPESPTGIINSCLNFLEVNVNDHEEFIKLTLMTLPGWAAYTQYYISWNSNFKNSYPVGKEDFLALRLVIMCLVWPDAKALLTWHKTQPSKKSYVDTLIKTIKKNEDTHTKKLLKNLSKNSENNTGEKTADAQFVFCIDVRSEPFRRALENYGNYETYGFAGFFGLPISIENAITGHSYSSCPVLLKPAHKVIERPIKDGSKFSRAHNLAQRIKKVYQSSKYNFATPFALAETAGITSAILMVIRNIFPKLGYNIKKSFKQKIKLEYSTSTFINKIPITDQINYAYAALHTMGLTDNFSSLVMFCAHGSSTVNNAYATALDCGACGGNSGSPNSRILARILNSKTVREGIKKKGIAIPDNTYFVAAKHNTTTDEMTIYDHNIPKIVQEKIQKIKQDLIKAKNQNTLWRCASMGIKTSIHKSAEKAKLSSLDWAQVRPEWGLAKNCTFIAAPRTLTKNIDLDGRAFLHSYEWQKDTDGIALETILTAPMVVAFWINSQYLFSTVDNVAFGAGNKVTKNITGKIGIIQGNASDLMTGLPFQSVYESDFKSYHAPMRLTTFVHAKKKDITKTINNQPVLQKLFKNQWVKLICIDPSHHKFYSLNKTLKWEEIK